jgi:hypothetical protein
LIVSRITLSGAAEAGAFERSDQRIEAMLEKTSRAGDKTGVTDASRGT